MSAVTAKVAYPEYLRAETSASVKHEYLDGAVYAMAGGTPDHAALALALGSEIRNAVKGKPCRVYSSDLRVRIPLLNASMYPDATVVCGQIETAADDPNAAVNPLIIVEVLSESTEGYDRGRKARLYRQIASLREYVLVSHSSAWVEVHRRTPQGTWETFDFREGEVLELRSIDAAIPVSAIYANPLSVPG